MAAVFTKAAIVTSWSGLPISGLLHQAASVTQSADDVNYPEATAGLLTSVNSLRTITGTLDGLLPVPEIGNAGAVAFDTGTEGYDANVQSWSMNINVAAVDTTAFGGSGVDTRYRTFIPGNYEWSGTFSAIIDDAEALHQAGEDGAVDATFTLSSGDTLAGAIYTTQLGAPLTINGLAIVNYSFRGSGALTAVGTNNIITAGAGIALPSALTLTFEYADNTTPGEFEVSAFWNSLSVTVSPGDMTRVQVGWQGSGAVTNNTPAAT